MVATVRKMSDGESWSKTDKAILEEVEIALRNTKLPGIFVLSIAECEGRALGSIAGVASPAEKGGLVGALGVSSAEPSSDLDPKFAPASRLAKAEACC